MEFLIVSDTKLKIMLGREEMKEFGLDKEELDYSDPEVRANFWRILDIASEECGFKTNGEKVLMQFYPSRSGGEIFITKLGMLSKSAEHTISSSGRVAMLSSETKIYKFDDLSSIVTAVHINLSALSEGLRAYLADNGSYYLIFELRNSKTLYAMSEFASEVPSELEAYIHERARIIDDPLNTFEKLYSQKENRR